MTTARSTLNIKYKIGPNDTRSFSSNNVHLELKHNGTTTLIQSPNVSSGTITFSNVGLSIGNSFICIKFASNDNLDSSGTTVDTLGTGFITRVDNTATELTIQG